MVPLLVAMLSRDDLPSIESNELNRMQRLAPVALAGRINQFVISPMSDCRHSQD